MSNVKIWRYIRFPQLVVMLESSALHFTRIDIYTDPFEGSYPLKNLAKYPSIEDAKLSYDAYKIYTAASCWHINEGESEAMWQLYLGHTEGVAIVSTIKRLRDCLKETDAYIVKVCYLESLRGEILDDYWWGKAFQYKRKCFAHKRELRAVVQNLPPSSGIVAGCPESGLPDGQNCIEEGGIDMDIDLKKLIQKIVIAPKSGKWFRGLVERTLERYSVTGIRVVESELARDPVYPALGEL